jgi:ABC-type polysaccharide/polyol phosphate export permease
MTVNNTASEYYDSAQRRHPLWTELGDVFRYRDLVWQFVISSIKTRYKRSFLGVIWTLLNPLLMMMVLTIVFSSFFKAVAHAPVYILNGLIVWSYLSTTTSGSMQNMVLSGALLGRIYVPKSVFAVSAAGAGLVNLGLSAIPLFIIALAIGVEIKLTVLAIIPAVVLLVIFALGVSLLLQTAAIFFADMIPVYEVFLTVWFYLTPVMYPLNLIPPKYAIVWKLNPMYHILRLVRAPLFEGVVPGWETWAIGALSAVVMLIVGGLVFTSKSHEYAYRV